MSERGNCPTTPAPMVRAACRACRQPARAARCFAAQASTAQLSFKPQLRKACWTQELARGRGGAAKTQARHLRSTVVCCERRVPKLDIEMMAR